MMFLQAARLEAEAIAKLGAEGRARREEMVRQEQARREEERQEAEEAKREAEERAKAEAEAKAQEEEKALREAEANAKAMEKKTVVKVSKRWIVAGIVLSFIMYLIFVMLEMN